MLVEPVELKLSYKWLEGKRAKTNPGTVPFEDIEGKEGMLEPFGAGAGAGPGTTSTLAAFDQRMIQHLDGNIATQDSHCTTTIVTYVFTLIAGNRNVIQTHHYMVMTHLSFNLLYYIFCL